MLSENDAVLIEELRVSEEELRVQADELAEARAAYRAAQNDPHVQQFASAQLEQAARALSSAERLAQETPSSTSASPSSARLR